MNKFSINFKPLFLLILLGFIPTGVCFAQTGTIANLAAACDKNNHAFAMSELATIIAREPNNDAAYATRAYCSATKGEIPNAVADADKSLRLNSRNITALGVRGFVKRYNKDYLGALDDFDRALKIEPGNKFIFTNWRDTFAGHSDPQSIPGVKEKLAAYKKEAELSNQNFETYARLDEFFRMIQPKANSSMKFEDKLRFDDEARKVALAYYQSLTAADSRNVCAYYFSAKGYRYSWKKEFYDNAINNYDGVKGARCSSAAALAVATGEYSERNSNPDEVIKYLNLALQRDPNNKDAGGWIARVRRDYAGRTASSSASSNNSYTREEIDRAVFQKELMEYEYNLNKLLKERAAIGRENSAALAVNKKKMLDVLQRGEQMYRKYLISSPPNIRTVIEKALSDALKLKAQIEAEN